MRNYSSDILPEVRGMNRLKVMHNKCNAAIESMNITDLQKLVMKAALGIDVRAEDMLASDLRITRHTALYLVD